MKNRRRFETQSEFEIPASLDYKKILAKAREYFYKLDRNIIGANIGPRRVRNSVMPNEYALVVYVLDKKPLRDLEPDQVIPREFKGLRTDVHAPLSANAPKATADFVADYNISRDLSSIDWVRVHELADELWRPDPQPPLVKDFGDICVIQNDGTVAGTNLSGGQLVDFTRAYHLFRTSHGDDYDFVTFFVDNASGVPNPIPWPTTSFYGAIYNDVQGIGLEAFNGRPGWGTTRLQAIHFINELHLYQWRYVMLQEFGHHFAAFVKYKDPVTGDTMTDHLLNGIEGHWNQRLDDHKSPMGYDNVDWMELPNGQFRRVEIESDERTYCNLDLYLMGLLGPSEVGEFKLLRNLGPGPSNTADYTATPVRLNIQNIIAEEGPRIPDVSAARKYWRQAFVVITNNISKVHDFVDRVDSLRLRWERDFSEATKGLGRVDTVLGVRSGRAADFTIIISSKQGFGREPGYLNSIEPGVPFVGPTKDFTFSCPQVNSAEGAVLMFQSRAVNSSKNLITVNGTSLTGGIPVSPSESTWNGNVMLIRAGALQEYGNVLHIESRNMSGGASGDLDEFILANMVVMYKTRL